MSNNATSPAKSAPSISAFWIILVLIAIVLSPGRAIASEPVKYSPVVLATDNAQFSIDPASLAMTGQPKGREAISIAQAGVKCGSVTGLQRAHGSASWQISTDDLTILVSASVTGNDLSVAIRPEGTTATLLGQRLVWPFPVDNKGIKAYALPVFGEGRYISVEDDVFAGLLASRLSPMGLVETSLPISTALYDGFSLTILQETPLDAEMLFDHREEGLVVGYHHEITQFNSNQAYRVRFSFAEEDPVAGAKLYRAWLEQNDKLRTLTEKRARNPDVAKLGGAAHIYVHYPGPLATDDVRDWAMLLAYMDRARSGLGMPGEAVWDAADQTEKADILEAIRSAREQGYVSLYSRQMVVRLFNDYFMHRVMEPVAPLPGGHDPQAQARSVQRWALELDEQFPGVFFPVEGWGDEFSTDMIDRLGKAGIDRAWIGAGDWREMIWHPAAVAAAKDAGYLVGVYDSYASAHPQDLANTWQTAQQGAEIYQAAAYTSKDGSKVTGFAGRGVYVNPVAVRDYARTRMSAVGATAGLNSYFIDVDATGLSFDDYTEGRETGRAEIIAEVQSRLAWTGDELGMVVGSEGGTALFAEHIAFGHGITTPPFGWMDPRLRRDTTSEFYQGGYWPPEAMPIYLEPTPVPDTMEHVIFAPEHKVPLYQIAFHDSVVTSHHWEHGSLKARGQRDVTGLLQILYQVPPLYHLSGPTADRDLPVMARFHARFSPLHRKLYDRQMTDFRYLSDDRLVQRTEFAGGTAVTVNFDRKIRVLADGIRIPVRGVIVEKPEGKTHFVLESLE